MRKIYLSFVIVLIVFLSGCGAVSAPQTPPEMPVPLSGHAALHCGGDVFAADFLFDGECSRFTLTSPARLVSVSLVCDASGGRMEKQSVRADLPRQSAFYKLHDALRSIRAGSFQDAEVDDSTGRPTRVPLGKDDFALLEYPEPVTQ